MALATGEDREVHDSGKNAEHRTCGLLHLHDSDLHLRSLEKLMATLKDFLSTVADNPDDFRVLYELGSLRALQKRIEALEADVNYKEEFDALCGRFVEANERIAELEAVGHVCMRELKATLEQDDD